MRSTAYRRQRKQRLTAAAGTLCLMLAVGIGTVVYLHRGNAADMRSGKSAENYAEDYAVRDEASYASEDSAAEAPSDGYPVQDAASEAAMSSEAEAQDSSAEESSAEPDTHADNPSAVFRAVPDEALFSYYGISGLPESLSGTEVTADGNDKTHDYLLADTAKAGFPHGLTYPDENSGTVIGDANTWMYREDETGNLLFVTISGRSFPEDYSAVPESVLHRCPLTTGGLYILIESDIADENVIDGGYAKELFDALTR